MPRAALLPHHRQDNGATMLHKERMHQAIHPETMSGPAIVQLPCNQPVVGGCICCENCTAAELSLLRFVVNSWLVVHVHVYTVCELNMPCRGRGADGVDAMA
jgi:hypothetical protein